MDENTKISDLTVAEFRVLFGQCMRDHDVKNSKQSVAMGAPDYKSGSQSDICQGWISHHTI